MELNLRAISAKLLLVSVLSTGAIATASLPANAVNTSRGTWAVTDCANTDNQFIQLSGVERKYGFAQSNVAARLINTGGGGTTAAAQLVIPLENRRFRADLLTIGFWCKGDPSNDSNTVIRMCFKADRGAGEIFTVERTLKATLKTQPQDGGWRLASIWAHDLARTDPRVERAVLDKLTFSLKTTGTLIVGDTDIRDRNDENRPVAIQLVKNDCGTILDCP